MEVGVDGGKGRTIGPLTDFVVYLEECLREGGGRGREGGEGGKGEREGRGRGREGGGREWNNRLLYWIYATIHQSEVSSRVPIALLLVPTYMENGHPAMGRESVS